MLQTPSSKPSTSSNALILDVPNPRVDDRHYALAEPARVACGSTTPPNHITKLSPVQIKDRFGGINLGDFFIETTDAANARLIELEGIVVENCTRASIQYR